MIVIVDDRTLITDAYRVNFGREGVPVAGFCSDEFHGWMSAAAEDDVGSIEAVLIGECGPTQGLARIIKRRCTAAVIAMKDERSLASTLQLFADGVDDVISKPCHAKEILARIEAISRRIRGGLSVPTQADDIQVFRDGRDPLVAGSPLSLPRRELRILEFLVGVRSRRVTRAQIYNSVYGLFDQEIDESVIESHISKLRRRLRQRLGYDPIESRRHLGYRIVYRPGQEARQERIAADGS